MHPLRAQCPLLYTFDGEDEEDALGTTVTIVGDVNGDGCDEILTGAGRYDVPGGQTNAGKVYLFSGLDGQLLHHWVGQRGAFGVVLASAGDVDVDGVSDIVVAAYGSFTAAGPWAGRVYVYSGATGETIWVWDGDRANDQFGWSVAGPGDLDGDGHADVVVGQKGHDSWRTFGGRVNAFSGATGKRLWFREGDVIGDQLGWSVAGAGDFNGDGTPDVVAGAPRGVPAYVCVFSGVDGSTLARIEGWTGSYDAFGAAVGGVGDVNGDSFSEIVLGAYGAGGESSASDNGQAYLLAGPDGRLLRTWEGEDAYDYFGYSVAAAGDVNGDVVPDVVVGAYGHWGAGGFGSGRAYVFSGADGSTIQFYDGEHPWDFFGLAVGGGGDADGDGLRDVVVATRHHGEFAADAGRAYVFTPALAGSCECWGRIDLVDLAELRACSAGPEKNGITTGCGCYDFDGDDDVDLWDFGVLQVVFGGRR
ncbi:MAG: VCBS repeat-containing protein [Planctomycetes bacterium]|nr:VCBS repeat-containing protein [Planctomycetota bacterium]